MEKSRDPATRARAIAQAAAARLETQHLAREWWRITKPNGETVDTYFCPPATQRDVLALFYPGAGVTPLP